MSLQKYSLISKLHTLKRYDPNIRAKNPELNKDLIPITYEDLNYIPKICNNCCCRLIVDSYTGCIYGSKLYRINHKIITSADNIRLLCYGCYSGEKKCLRCKPEDHLICDLNFNIKLSIIYE